MSEPWIPQPPPEEHSHWDPTPARCPECGRIIDAWPASRADGRWEGKCPQHGIVPAFYTNGEPEDEEEHDVEE
jgi:hypothetical protein